MLVAPGPMTPSMVWNGPSLSTASTTRLRCRWRSASQAVPSAMLRPPAAVLDHAGVGDVVDRVVRRAGDGGEGDQRAVVAGHDAGDLHLAAGRGGRGGRVPSL